MTPNLASFSDELTKTALHVPAPVVAALLAAGAGAGVGAGVAGKGKRGRGAALGALGGLAGGGSAMGLAGIAKRRLIRTLPDLPAIEVAQLIREDAKRLAAGGVLGGGAIGGLIGRKKTASPVAATLRMLAARAAPGAAVGAGVGGVRDGADGAVKGALVGALLGIPASYAAQGIGRAAAKLDVVKQVSGKPYWKLTGKQRKALRDASDMAKVEPKHMKHLAPGAAIAAGMTGGVLATKNKR